MSVISNLFLTLLLVNSAFSQEYEGDVCKISKNNVKWTCKSLETCESALRKLKTERPEVCSFSGFNVIVCCEPKSSPTSTEQSSSVTAGITPSITPVTVTENPTRAKPTGLKSEQKCREYAKFVYQKPSQVALSVNIPDEDYDNDDKENTCSISKVPLIVDGSPVSPREFPHQVIIGYQYGSKTKWACAGSLISENFVLSAAHCSKTPFGRPRYAKIGDLDTSTNTDDAKPETLNIVEIFDHPSYLTDFPYNDIALYKLEKNVSIDGYKRPACLNTKRNIQENKAVATGWGNIEYGGVSSQHLLKVSLDLIANKNCSTFWRSGGSLNRGIDDEQMICAGDLVGKKDTCQGDSGGPLQIKLKEPYCMYSIIGVTSFGRKCGVQVPGVYTRVSNYVPWIESIIWP
ncbi:venom protease-like isoform X1 [Lycorma delicatula]|uniref:venom protease-like isoform X1 n=1 Tax=Lycorma delicatula TaxID=130591 RepID=UPI003F51A867